MHVNNDGNNIFFKKKKKEYNTFYEKMIKTVYSK